jgi:transcriptional regulator CtsR
MEESKRGGGGILIKRYMKIKEDEKHTNQAIHENKRRGKAY